MNSKMNLEYKIPYPLKEIIKDIASCIYESDLCQYSSADIATAMVISAIENKSLNSVAKSPDSDTEFWRIYKGITPRNLERLAKTQKPPKGSHIRILVDGHDKMFGGKDALGRVGTKPKNGTSWSFKYLVAFTTNNPKRVIAIRELFDGSVANDTMELINELSKDYIIDIVIMDGEFYKAELIAYLSDVGIHYVVRRTNTENIRELGVRYSEPYFYRTEVERVDGKIVHLNYWIYRYKGKDGDFFLISDMKKNPKKIRKMYRTRWEIETGFREINRIEIKTTTRDFLVRLFFYTVSCIVYNLWQKIRFRCNLFVIKLEDIVDQLKIFFKELMLSSIDIIGRMRCRYVRLKI